MNSTTRFTQDRQSEPIATVLEQPLPLQADCFHAEPLSDRQSSECYLWLSEHQVWGKLPAEIL
ncbi:hypothetical protein V2H45_12160 [Tumidithrix elongata RA019]|uniref:Uncharacterized protein n=1 Tax=Tumidithrix elongata BACA0141 TaxID=2716417 RepID=A0AAW9Q3V5_9CYAN|nr:hypothetical protein [Tumidithrix elongata RA019]